MESSFGIGETNDTNIHLINSNIVSYISAGQIIFHRVYGHTNTFSTGINNFKCGRTKAVKLMCAHPSADVFAVVNNVDNCNLYIYEYPSFNMISEFEDVVKFEFLVMQFANFGSIIGVISGLSDYKFMLLNYFTNETLCAVDISSENINYQIRFNPSNWKDIVLYSNKDVSTCLVEQYSTNYCIEIRNHSILTEYNHEDYYNFILNDMDLSDDCQINSIIKVENKNQREISNSTIISIKTKSVNQDDKLINYKKNFAFDVKNTNKMYIIQCWWSINGNVIVYILSGELYEINFKSGKVLQIYNLNDKNAFSLSNNDDPLNCQFHKDGLYVTTKFGYLNCYTLNFESMEITINKSEKISDKDLIFAMWNNNCEYLFLKNIENNINQIKIKEEILINKITNYAYGKIVGVISLCGSEDYSYVFRENGLYQSINSATGMIGSYKSLNITISIVVAHPLHKNIVFIGNKEGFVYFVKISEISYAVLSMTRLFKQPITSLNCTNNGKLLLVGSRNVKIFIINMYGQRKFETIGYIEVPSLNYILSTNGQDKYVSQVICAINDVNDFSEYNKFVQFSLDSALLNNHYESIFTVNKNETNTENEIQNTLKFSDTLINTTLWDLKLPCRDISLTKELKIYGSGVNVMHTYIYNWLTDPPRKKFRYSPIEIIDDSNLNINYKLLKINDTIIKYDNTGNVKVCSTANSKPYETHVLAHKQNKIKNLYILSQENLIYLLFEDNCLQCIKLNNVSMDKYNSYILKNSTFIKTEHDAVQTIKLPEDFAIPEETWCDLQNKKKFDQESIVLKPTTSKLKREIGKLRNWTKRMLDENENKSDIEKLNRTMFDLDVAEQKRLQTTFDKTLNQKNEEQLNINKNYLNMAKVIKEECWDSMELKGRVISAFEDNSTVESYTMEIETMEDKCIMEEHSNIRAIELFTDNLGDPDDKVKTLIGSKTCYGSVAPKFDGLNKFVYSQFELNTREKMIRQISFIKMCIKNVKLSVNKEFDKLMDIKNDELKKMEKWNNRMLYIQNELSLCDVLPKYQISVLEKPEMVLSIKDEEIKVEKYYSEEEEKRMSHEKALEQEKLIQEKSDNWRERGLLLMMDGVLEIRKEDELKKDIIKPEFMKHFDESEWTEEQSKMAADYEKKVYNLNEERERFRKQLELEYIKLKGLIQDVVKNFDSMVAKLSNIKIESDIAIKQEELKICRINLTLACQETHEISENDFKEKIEVLKLEKIEASNKNKEFKKVLDVVREQYEILFAEDKVMDKQFKKEFNDVSSTLMDQLYKLFKKRPGILSLKSTLDHSFGFVENKTDNPFNDKTNSEIISKKYQRGLDAVIRELNKESHAPEFLDLNYWHGKFIPYRQKKILTEQTLKRLSYIKAEIQTFIQKYGNKENTIRRKIEDQSDLITLLKKAKQLNCVNLQIQIVLKQGQIESKLKNNIYEFSDSILLHRINIEDLNVKIKTMSDEKIEIMIENKDFKRGIYQLEWERERMIMKLTDYLEKMKELSRLKVTREIQKYLESNNYDGLIANEISTYEKTLINQKQFHDKRLKEFEKSNSILKKQILTKQEQNYAIKLQIEDINVSVLDRHYIDDMIDKNAKERALKNYKKIIRRRHLIEIAKSQAQEISILRAEVERLRMRTFPALVQFDR